MSSVETPDVVGTVFDEEGARVARTYAEALVNVAAKTEQVEAVVSELEEIEADILKPHPVIAEILASPSVPHQDKDRILKDALSGRALPTVLRFLEVLNNHGRLGLIAPIAREARALWDRRQNRRPVQITSAVELDDTQKANLEQKVAVMIAATPVPRYSVDPELIGGLIVQVGDDVYDASLRTQLQKLRQTLVNGKARDLIAGASLAE